MYQDISSKYNCCYDGHEKQKVIGYCLLQGCQNAASFCKKCTTTDRSKVHQEHQEKYCIRFSHILPIIQQAITEQKIQEEDYEVLRFQLIKWEKIIQKFYTYQYKQPFQKWSNIIPKVQSINLKLIERQKLLERLMMSLKEKNYEYFRDNINFVKKLFCLQKVPKIFSIITVLTENKQNALQKMENILSLIEKSARLYMNRGKRLYDQGKEEQALEQFEEAIIRQEQFSEAYFWKGFVLEMLNRYEDAIKCYDEALRQDSKNLLAYQQKGNALQKLNRYQDAIKCYDEAIRQDPKNVFAYQYKGNALQKLNRYQDAIKCFDQVISFDPHHNYSIQAKSELQQFT